MKTLIANVMSFKFLAVAAAMGALPLMATEYTWKGAASGGSWDEKSNWTTDGSTDADKIPGGDDTAIIPATYTSGVSLKMDAQWASVSNLVLNADLEISSDSNNDLRLAITTITNSTDNGVGGKFIMAKDNMKLMPRAMNGAPNHYISYWYQPIVAKSSDAKISLTQHTNAGNGGACTAYLYGPIEGSGQLTIYTEWEPRGTDPCDTGTTRDRPL